MVLDRFGDLQVKMVTLHDYVHAIVVDELEHVTWATVLNNVSRSVWNSQPSEANAWTKILTDRFDGSNLRHAA